MELEHFQLNPSSGIMDCLSEIYGKYVCFPNSHIQAKQPHFSPQQVCSFSAGFPASILDTFKSILYTTCSHSDIHECCLTKLSCLKIFDISFSQDKYPTTYISLVLCKFPSFSPNVVPGATPNAPSGSKEEHKLFPRQGIPCLPLLVNFYLSFRSQFLEGNLFRFSCLHKILPFIVIFTLLQSNFYGCNFTFV